MATPVEIALNLTKQGDGAVKAADELTQAHEAALVLGDAALKAEREQARWNATLEQLSTAGLERLEAQLGEVIAETEKAGGSTAALRGRLDDVKGKLGETSDYIRRTAADYRDLDKAQGGVASGAGKLANKFVRELAPAVVALKLKSLAEQALTYAEGIKDAGERTGLTTEEVQRLTYAANQNATSFSELESGLKNLAVAAENDAEKLRALGIETKTAEGSTRPLREILGDLSQVIAETEDPTKRTSLAVQFLGRSGQQLVPLLSQGRVALKEFGDEAERSGRVISDETVARLDAAKQRLDDFSQRVTIFSASAVSAFMDVGEGMGQIAADIANALSGLPSFAEGLDFVASSASGVANAQGSINSEVERGIRLLIEFKRAAQEAYERDQQDKDMTAIERANKRIAAEEEAQRTPEQKAAAARTARESQFDREVYSIDRMPNRENAAAARALLEKERDLDLAKIDAEAKAERARLDAEAQTKRDAATTARRETESGQILGLVGADAPGLRAGAQSIGASAKAAGDTKVFEAAKRLDEAARAAAEGGTTQREAEALAAALDNLLAVVTAQGKESASLRASVARINTQVAGLLARANTKG